MFTALRWVGGHVAGFYAAVGVFLISAVVLIVLAGLIFAKIADDVMEGSTQAFDDAVEELATALTEHEELIAREVLATTVERTPTGGTHTDPDLGLTFSVERRTTD